MDWIKVKRQHIVPTGLALKQIGVLVKIQLLTADLERMPTDEEIARAVPKATLNEVQEALERSSTTLQEVLEKVLEDVQDVQFKRSRWKERQKRHRVTETDTVNVTRDVTGREKRREEKRREDEINTIKTPTALQVTIDHYLTITDVPREQWTVAYPRHVKHGKDLLKLCGGDSAAAVAAINKAKEFFEGKRLSWVLSTVVKHFHNLGKDAIIDPIREWGEANGVC